MKRGFLSIGRAVVLWLLLICQGPANAEPLPKLAPVDLTKISPGDFTDEELDLPYYLEHFHRLANSVQDEGEHRGFITLDCWRGTRNQKHYNARIMENCLSLTYFYCTDRPWNPYYADPALRQRLEAALTYWCNMQAPDGHFSEYGVGQWTLAPTAFAVKFMGEALVLLADGPQIDPEIHHRTVEAVRKAIRIVLTDPALFEHGKRYSNQFTNIFPGGLAFFSVHPDEELEAMLLDMIRQSGSLFQSPAGYFYERDGCDWAYNLRTHHSNLFMAYHYSRNQSLQGYFIEEEARYIEWLAYNALLEPDTDTFLLNRAIETRQAQGTITRLGPFLEQMVFLTKDVPLARAFVMTKTEADREITRRREELEQNWPEVPPLVVGGFWSFTPYRFLNRKHPRWYPTQEQRKAAVSQLPYLRNERFIHLRSDSRKKQQFTYIRRPGYYAVFNTGEQLTAQQRFGLGILWTPQMGTVLQSRTRSQTLVWGTQARDAERLYEAGTLDAEITIDGTPVEWQPGRKDVPGDVLVIRYPLGEDGQKEIRFTDEGLTVAVTHPGPFTEMLPLLLDSDDPMTTDKGVFRYERGKTILRLELPPDIQPVLGDAAGKTESIAGKQPRPLVLEGRDKLEYTIVFENVPD